MYIARKRAAEKSRAECVIVCLTPRLGDTFCPASYPRPATLAGTPAGHSAVATAPPGEARRRHLVPAGARAIGPFGARHASVACLMSTYEQTARCQVALPSGPRDQAGSNLTVQTWGASKDSMGFPM
ncbi:hypothetical protein DPEC_G00026340 [Dallia pectoralis]|uniref:Uncharacterized protein n=1 Tax=Dallia pectoralis TaxID=75939 RepID=A0ACC2HHG6_DALPE|nr:hypothetical protein DPEC_G00026340 [Dallia pectoralis]